MTSSSRSEIDLSSLGWPIHEQKSPSSQVSAALHTAGLPSLGMRICKETSHSTNPFCLWLAYEDLWHEYAQDGWGPPPESPTPPPFSIQHVSGYGNGMVANRAIKTGETILFERPIVVYPSVFICHEDHPRGQWGELEDLYEAGFPALGETERSLYLELWNCKPLTGTLGNKIMGLARTNGLNTTFTRSKHLPVYAGVFPTISRCNHSCGPNASAKFNEETMAMRLFSRRPIAPGEQIMISYVAPLMYAPRQEELKRKYLFTCECNYCKPSKPSRPSRPLKHPFWNTANQTTNKHVDFYRWNAMRAIFGEVKSHLDWIMRRNRGLNGYLRHRSSRTEICCNSTKLRW
ncbi:SET domain-containing protein [Rickenella mellea]|uniref:SET domain-containing protein n=1 Tax=Rickenella mellea TaxID=50990 RepID=A0A4Y7Q9L0_9AGAM|nr:SET domain-containing protein [Rickenella mellea]